MQKNSKPNAKVAIFWDKSYLWGLIAFRTFRQLGIDFALLTSGDIRKGRLAGFDLVFVPGGWASDKIKALGNEGAAAIRKHVAAGGGYLGFCGGAGLALSHESGLGLAPFGRLPTGMRLPSFSGKISLRREAPAHPMWKDIEDGTAFYAWWPGQFALEDADDARVLATYGDPRPGSFVTDLPIGPEYDWSKWEQIYGINLSPDRIIGQPAVIEVSHGEGKIILSYLHFETPEDGAGHRVLVNLLEYLSGKATIGRPDNGSTRKGDRHAGGPAAAAARDLERHASDFIAFGKQNFLWYWRNRWLLQWRRGVRGIEYSTLYGMLAELKRLVEKYDASLGDETVERIATLKKAVPPFFDDARRLIILERFAMSQGPIGPLKSDDEEINLLRDKLFSGSKRCGGIYEEIIDEADAILLPLLNRELKEK